MATVSIVNQCDHAVDERQLCQVVKWILDDAGHPNAEVSIAIVTDDTIWKLNAQHLQHDYPTDVLSFRLDDESQHQRLEGEIVVSAETAAREAGEYDWPTAAELLLYVIHGTLHLVGLDDATAEQRAQMRAAEAEYLARVDAKLGHHHRLTR